jgi:LysR family transcriptional regulator, hydrogen peroxide-inducible genes activator
MNLQQLSYVLAVDKHRHFAKAAEACCISQPTLSMMIQKLEEELELKIFDRSKQPVIPTEVGKRIIIQTRQVLAEIENLKNISREEKNLFSGELRVGIIPTIAPYLLPMFWQSFKENYPEVKLKISENTTSNLIEKLMSGELDAGIMVNPDDLDIFTEYELFTENFVVYSAKHSNKPYLLAEDIDPADLLLLEEGHCFRTQIMKFCEISKQQKHNIAYASGSLETLKNLSDKHLGVTILPEIATLYFNEDDITKIKHFAEPQPFRKVSMVTHRHYLKERLVTLLQNEIKTHLPPQLSQTKSGVEISFTIKEN